MAPEPPKPDPMELIAQMLQAQQKRDEAQERERKAEREERKAEKEEQERRFNTILERLTGGAGITAPAPTVSSNGIAWQTCFSRIDDFNYDPDSGTTFEAWFKRFETVFTKDAEAMKLEESERVLLLTRRLSTPIFNRLREITAPKEPHELKFDELRDILKKNFGPKDSLFQRRHALLRMRADPDEDLIAFLDKVNHRCEAIDLDKLQMDQLKCLIFACALQDPTFSDILQRILPKLEAKHETTTLKEIREEIYAMQVTNRT